jgi:hypothetical protein
MCDACHSPCKVSRASDLLGAAGRYSRGPRRYRRACVPGICSIPSHAKDDFLSPKSTSMDVQQSREICLFAVLHTLEVRWRDAQTGSHAVVVTLTVTCCATERKCCWTESQTILSRYPRTEPVRIPSYKAPQAGVYLYDT